MSRLLYTIARPHAANQTPCAAGGGCCPMSRVAYLDLIPAPPAPSLGNLHAQKVESDRDFHDLHAAAEVFSPETEQVYKYLQVSVRVVWRWSA